MQCHGIDQIHCACGADCIEHRVAEQPLAVLGEFLTRRRHETRRRIETTQIAPSRLRLVCQGGHAREGMRPRQDLMRARCLVDIRKIEEQRQETPIVDVAVKTLRMDQFGPIGWKRPPGTQVIQSRNAAKVRFEEINQSGIVKEINNMRSAHDLI